MKNDLACVGVCELTSEGLPEITITSGGGTGEDRLQPVYPDEVFDRCVFAKRWVARHHIHDAFGTQLVFADANGVFRD